MHILKKKINDECCIFLFLKKKTNYTGNPHFFTLSLKSASLDEFFALIPNLPLFVFLFFFTTSTSVFHRNNILTLKRCYPFGMGDGGGGGGGVMQASLTEAVPLRHHNTDEERRP